MYAAVAQLAEHSSHKARVMSSILISRKLFWLFFTKKINKKKLIFYVTDED